MADLPRYYLDGAYLVCDRKRSRTDPIACCDHADDAARIVRLLNADLERTERQGAVVP